MNDGYFPLPVTYERDRHNCRSCGAPICFITTVKGAQMPLDLRTIEQRDGVTMAQTHFATCPQGRAWSKKTSQQ